MNSCLTICLSLSFFIKIFGTEAAPNYIYHDCPNTSLFSPNSTYQSNLHTLLSSLSSSTTHGTDGFANATAGQNPPDQAYGLFLCRGDLDIATCSICVATGKQEILRRCPNRRSLLSGPITNPQQHRGEGFSWWVREEGRRGGGKHHEHAEAVRTCTVHVGLDGIRLWHMPPVRYR
ncbi:hypothetical protein EUGRSUZ_E04172 [Eucalyptus grandis]|uniref:Uncharacterized protein n=2 Tax=Eucalyptus grandis TaxID=71139 RepID=A0ACC3KZY6_EUCGR|nr:hypothetical protein EUGRSUZ_E04172 [Eucalyptus grandis]